MTKRRLILSMLIVLAVAAVMPAQAAESPKNVILLIGDGMGPAQVSLARLSLQSPLAMDSMQYAGFVKTQSANSTITDSAAAGTALATGFKTNNGMISTLPDGKQVQTILEAAQKMGKAVGLVSTVTITDATPAAFASHAATRKSMADIAPQFLEKKVDVILGGGKGYFIPKSQPDSKREDERDLTSEAKSADYVYVDTRDGLLSAKGAKLLGLFANSSMSTEPPQPTIAEMAEKAISILSTDKDGFFVMIEGGQIDYACHANDAAEAVKQILDFDAAVGKALDFARTHPDTLVIMTADHETGGMTIIYPTKGSAARFKVAFSTTGHTACNVPLLAFGPGADRFSGVLDNTDIPKRIAQLWGIRGFAE